MLTNIAVSKLLIC